MDAMTRATLVLLGVAAMIGLVIVLKGTVARDGWGHRPPPTTRHDWAEGTTVEIERSTQVHA